MKMCSLLRGDIGNEYIYPQKGTEPAEPKKREVLENTARFAKVLLKHELIPSADEKLDAEQRGIIEFYDFL